MRGAQVLLCLAWVAWSRAALEHGDQACVNEGQFSRQEVPGVQSGPFRLVCPVTPDLLTSTALSSVTWLKNCVPLPSVPASSPTQGPPVLSQPYLQFPSLQPEDQGNYTCRVLNSSFTIQLSVPASLCSRAPVFSSSGGEGAVQGVMGSSVDLHCQASLPWVPHQLSCHSLLTWSHAGQQLANLSLHPLDTNLQFSGENLAVVSSVLTVDLREEADFGLYACEVRNASVSFNIQRVDSPSHSGAVLAAVVLLLLLALAAVVYAKCRLNLQLWYRNSYGDFEINDGKMYDAYISYVNNENDRKFVNFILKPHLENKCGHRLLLNDTNILPGAEPSAELLMGVSRSRRLIVVLSEAYLEQEWCTSTFRQGMLHLLELSQRPIFITFQAQQKRLRSEVIQQLHELQPRITMLSWGAHSMTPSSAMWKQLSLAMPRRVVSSPPPVGLDPQTLLQDDEDPMLTQQPDYLDCSPDPDPAGDLGLRLPIFKTPCSRAPVLPPPPPSGPQTSEPRGPEIDVSDLGSRDYAARTDFYCLVSKDDV